MQNAQITSELLPIQVRNAKTEDLPFIFDSYRYSRIGTMRPANSGPFGEKARATLKMLCVRGARFVVANFVEDENQIVGWMCSERGLLHYVYVKAPYRRQGVVYSLLAMSGLTGNIACTHWSATASLATHDKPYVYYIGLEAPKNLEVDLGKIKLDSASGTANR